MIDPTYVTVICDNISYSNFNFCTSRWPVEKSLDEIILAQTLISWLMQIGQLCKSKILAHKNLAYLRDIF